MVRCVSSPGIACLRAGVSPTYLMKYLLLLLLLPLTGVAQTMDAQPQDEVAIMDVIDALFEGMKKADAGLVRSAFAPAATLQTVVSTGGVVSLKTESVEGLATAIGKAKPGDLNEVIDPYQILADGDLATAFIPYKFYLNDQLHHCGANALTLVRLGGAWKIQAVIDTRRPCL